MYHSLAWRSWGGVEAAGEGHAPFLSPGIAKGIAKWRLSAGTSVVKNGRGTINKIGGGRPNDFFPRIENQQLNFTYVRVINFEISQHTTKISKIRCEFVCALIRRSD